MVTSGVVWCLKDNQWIPLQLNAIRLHGVLTQAHWSAIAEFLQRVANKELVLQENGFTELTEQQKELLQKNGEWQSMVERERIQHLNNPEKLDSNRLLCQIPEDGDNNLFINLFEEQDEKNKKATERKTSSEQNDEIVLRLLRKYCKYSRDALDDEIVNAIDACVDKKEDSSAPGAIRRRKLGYCPKEEKIYENFNDKNEQVLQWLKDQQQQQNLPVRRHSSIETSNTPKPPELRKSSVTLPLTSEHFKNTFNSISKRKNSITSTTSSCSESEETGSISSITSHWQRILKKHLGSKSIEKRLKKQREAWARSTRKLSNGGSSNSELEMQP